MKIVSHETHICRDIAHIIHLKHKDYSFSFQVRDNSLSTLVQQTKDTHLSLDICGKYSVMGTYSRPSGSSNFMPWMCLYIQKNAEIGGKVVAMCWNEGTRVILRHDTSCKSFGLNACLQHMISLLPWHLWVRSCVPSIVFGVTDGTYKVPIANTLPNDTLHDCIGSLMAHFKRKNARTINQVNKILAKSPSFDRSYSVADELSLVGIMHVHSEVGRTLKKNEHRVLFLQDMSVFEMPRKKFKEIEKYQDEVDPSQYLCLKVQYSEGITEPRGIVFESCSTVHSLLLVTKSTPIIIWQVPFTNVLAIQGVKASDTLIEQTYRSVHHNPIKVNSQSTAQSKPSYARHMYQNILTSFHANAFDGKIACSPVANNKLSPHLAVISTLINISLDCPLTN